MTAQQFAVIIEPANKSASLHEIRRDESGKIVWWSPEPFVFSCEGDDDAHAWVLDRVRDTWGDPSITAITVVRSEMPSVVA